MKKLFALLSILLLCIFALTGCGGSQEKEPPEVKPSNPNATLPSDQGWIPLGHFVKSKKVKEPAHEDIQLISHIKADNSDKEGYAVYYKHDHKTDEDKAKNPNFTSVSMTYEAKITPLGKDGKPMANSNSLENGDIICEYEMRAKGAYGITIKSFRIYGQKSHKLYYEAKLDPKNRETFYIHSAAEEIAKATVPHPVPGGDRIGGSLPLE